MVHIELERVKGDFGFRATDSNGHVVQLDSSIENGGSDFGVRPMQSLLMGLGACSAIDIVSILKKQRQDLKGFKIVIDGEREDAKPISLWKTVHMVIKLSGPIDEEKARKACALSIEKYCSVAETLRRAGASITWELILTP